MTDDQILTRLARFYDEQYNVTICLLAAMDFFEMGEETESWLWLFEWEEARHARDKFWKRFQDYYFDALVLKEGVQP